MSIPYNDNLSLSTYQSNPYWHQSLQAPSPNSENTISELFVRTFKQGCVRSIQLIRDTARLVLKVPIRAIAKPIFLEKNWQELERAKINTKLTGYAFVQFASVPIKFIVASIALATQKLSQEKAKRLFETSEEWTMYLDGRASQLEALKEEGAKTAQSRHEFDQYRTWLYSIDPKLCRKMN